MEALWDIASNENLFQMRDDSDKVLERMRSRPLWSSRVRK
jgi:hypothetical protein